MLATVVLLSACLPMAGLPLREATAQTANLVETASAAGNFQTLVAAVQAAGLVETLQGDGPFTVFAPTDDAFGNLPPGTLDSLLKPENRGALAAILTYHVVPGRVTAREAFSLRTAGTVNGQRLDLRFEDRRLRVDGAAVVQADIACSNGVIHIIDSVLLPNQKTIPEVAAEAGQFGTLLAAVEAAGLAEALTGQGPFTVLAPTDAAFQRLPEGTVENLLKPENRQQLVDILKYHVIPERVFLEDALAARRARTLQGQPVQFSVKADGPRANDAVLLTADIDTANGVIHVIDRVLTPPRMTAEQVMGRLEAAVNQGASLYNRGHASSCVKVYEQACREILEVGGPEMPESVTGALRTSMQRASKLHHMGQRAWTLRRGIDQAYQSLSRLPQMSQSVQRQP